MKDRTKILLTVAVCLLLLSGCGCSHEWEAAGCETAGVCTRCGQTGEEALGHDWAAADCTAAQTCNRCGQTQGEPLDHTYGEWQITETEMTRNCSICGAEETAEVSEEMLAEHLLVGHWDFLLLIHDNNITDPYRRQDAYVAYSAEADADGSFRLRVGQDLEHALQWEFDAHDPEKNIYTYTMTREDTQNQATAYLQRLEGMDQLLLPFAEGVKVFLFRDSRLTEGLTGTWKGTEDAVDYVLELAQDRTFTGDMDGQISGSWYLRPLKELNHNYYCIGLTLLGTRNAEPFEHMVLIPVYGDPATEDIANQLQTIGSFSLVVQEGGPEISFRRENG